MSDASTEPTITAVGSALESVPPFLPSQSATQTALSVLAEASRTQRPNVMSAYNRAPLLSAFEFLAPALKPGANVLDLGCGSGSFTRALASLGVNAYGIDISDDEVSIARNYGDTPNAHYTVGRIERLPYPDAFFDAAISISVLQYSHWPSAIAECRRVLKPGARCCFVENLAGNPLAKAYRAFRRVAWAYAPNLRPTMHVAWQARAEFERVFVKTQFSVHHLSTLALLIPHALKDPRPTAWSTFTQNWFERLSQFDARFFERYPTAACVAWLVVICCER